jgi:Fic family protein
MKRGQTGRYETTTIGGETIRAFVPSPLPPKPALILHGPIQPLLERALLALGRLDSVSTLLPDTQLFLYTYIRKEAVLSSQIEGTQSSLADLLLFEMDQAPGVSLDDVVEVSNYVAALEHGLTRMRTGFPLSTRLIREIHAVLLSRGRGSDKEPGEFRRSQNWIGGTRPGNAVFVPPPHTAIHDCMSELERFLYADRTDLPVLIKAALTHVQFETIPPFLDGNGRIGRLLIVLFLQKADVLHEPLLYLSLYFKQHRQEYYRLLDNVRTNGDWEMWITFFLQGVAETCEGAVDTARRIENIFEDDRRRIQSQGRRSGSALQVHQAVKTRPIITLREIVRRSEISFPAAVSGMAVLIELGICRELTGKKRNRIFAYEHYIELLKAGTDPY